VRYIYYFIINDGSGGAHNPAYVKELLTYAELVTLTSPAPPPAP